MHGLMMNWPLVIPSILRRASQFFPEKEIVSRKGDGGIYRTNYGALSARVNRLASALLELGVRPGDRIATCAWNHQRHLELYFAIPAIGAVLHTINFRLPREHLLFIINHAQDRLVFLDRSLGGILADLQSELPTVEKYIFMDERGAEPPALPAPLFDYEQLIADAGETYDAPALDESMAAGLCYTSGTTGEPKGVLYSHRSTFLHAMAGCMVDGGAMCEREVSLPAVPMFHVNGWGLPYSCTLAGATQVLPGPLVIGKPLADLLEAERVTCSAGVPTIWHMLYQALKEGPKRDLSRLHTLLVGGAAAPRSLIENFERDFGIRVLHAWGMTETSPIGSMGRLKSAMESWSDEQKMEVRLKQGIPVAGVETRILDELDRELPWDGRHSGELVVRGPWIASGYYNVPDSSASFTKDGWFRTGDIAAIDTYGYIQITDRKKDLIKRKGEWISSVDMENAVLGHPGVLEAAVVGRVCDVRDEVPVVFAVRKPEFQPPATAEEVIKVLEGKFALWQLPQPGDVVFVPALPKTGVGKLDKKLIRKTLVTLETGTS